MKKTPYTLGAIALLAGASALSAQTITHNFQFNDAAQTGLQSAANTGTVSTDTWNFDVQNVSVEGATNGSAFVLGTDATAGTIAISKDYTRKVTFATAFTAGTYQLDVKMASWDLTSGVANEGFTFKLGDAAASAQVNQIFAVNAAPNNVRSRHATSGTATGTAAQTNVGYSGSNFSWRVEGNLDTGAFTTSYSTDGVAYTALITDGAGITDIGEFILAIEGDTPWNAASQTAIDSITLTVIPEPSTFALLGGLCALGYVMVRRRRA
ncbi:MULTISPECIES: PEP-CTERM sorting domain-containing protein [unclassified Lentimonas]|uniref:PEP-CTERM sorting domain-containing protein n=1 Tax=unclassified Lentimonas TaxID=2630993 RepID=UPI00132C1542|nr:MULTISPECIES: PEP-CTERM sorting domain-containing protein [unclassified Lentimonas]CAA6694114.1 Unannotated [Lentimonas sp. CC19]CAA6694387.1 Unannotated [Lentimonas sp. CC10]CAA7070347.1 Unannotated [Lentimonas sp. CC11]